MTEARTRFTRLLAEASAAPNAQLFARDVLDEWELPDLAEQVCAGIGELVGWVLDHGANALVEIALVWDGDSGLLFAEVADRGMALPDGERVPRGECEDRGAEHRDLGRVLWASYAAALPALLAAGGAR